jgi:hypothetical protein
MTWRLNVRVSRKHLRTRQPATARVRTFRRPTAQRGRGESHSDGTCVVLTPAALIGVHGASHAALPPPPPPRAMLPARTIRPAPASPPRLRRVRGVAGAEATEPPPPLRNAGGARLGETGETMSA